VRASDAGGGDGTEVRFGVHVRNDNSEGTPRLVQRKAVWGPGDQGEPVVTVMLPGVLGQDQGAWCRLTHLPATPAVQLGDLLPGHWQATRHA
jgi:hypothetical protein